jgi:Tfp pilus assembly protein FimT
MVKGAAARKRREGNAAGALDAMLRQAHSRAQVQGLGDDLLGRDKAGRDKAGREKAGQGRDKGGTSGHQAEHQAGTQQNQDIKSGGGFSSVRAQLTGILADPNAPAATRGQAARTLAEMDGLIGRHQAAPDRAGDVPPAELSRAELVAELARLRQIAAPEAS